MKLPLRSSLLGIAPPSTLKKVGLWLIIAGLIGEAVTIIFVAPGTREKTLSVIFTLLIAFGVWLEEVGAEAIEAHEKHEAQLILGELNARTAEAERNSLEAQVQLEKERAERLKLEARIAPRRLSEEQRATLLEWLAPFKGRKIRIESYAVDPEGEVFAEQIMAAFAPLFAIDNWIGCERGSPFIRGVSVTGSDGPLIDKLVGAFENAGVKGVGITPPPDSTQAFLLLASSRTKDPDSVAVILVGVKPLAQQ